MKINPLPLLGLGSLALLSCTTEKTPSPNVIFIIADDQGWGDISYNGNLTVSTPHIDRIAEEGVHLDNFYVCPVSSPTRSEFLSGRYSHRAGVFGVTSGSERMDTAFHTIGDYFHDAGYATGFFGKWHSGTQHPYHPNARGFEEYYGFCSGHWGDYIDALFLEHNGKVVQGKGFLPDDLTDHVLDYIDASADRPFFAVLALNTPHSPMQVPDELWKKWQDRPLRQTATDSTREDPDFTRAALALTENIDANVGRILEALKNKGIEDNTIVVYMTDNGPNSHRWNGGMKGIKGSGDEGGVRSPLFIRWKNHLEAGKTVSQLSGAVDLLPTFLSLCGIEAAGEGWDGMDISGYIRENLQDTDRELIRSWGGRTVVRKGDFLFSNDRLYQVRNDRCQNTPLSKDHFMYEPLKKRAESYRKEMEKLRKKVSNRPFTVGAQSETFCRLPVRDASFSGNVKRSCIHANCSYLENWISAEDRIIWETDVLSDGEYAVTLYAAGSPQDTGALVHLTATAGPAVLSGKMTLSTEPQEKGCQFDRVKRRESYMWTFEPVELGTIELRKGRQQFILSADPIPGKSVAKVFMLILEKKTNKRD